jgi:hypothetical protein
MCKDYRVQGCDLCVMWLTENEIHSEEQAVTISGYNAKPDGKTRILQ